MTQFLMNYDIEGKEATIIIFENPKYRAFASYEPTLPKEQEQQNLIIRGRLNIRIHIFTSNIRNNTRLF